MFTNLIEQLSTEDKQKIINYIGCYGVRKEDFIGLDQWLAPWSHANQKLYKLLGNQLIREFDFTYHKTEELLKAEIREKLLFSEFKTSYHKFYGDIIVLMWRNGEINGDQKLFFNHLLDTYNFVNDKIEYGIKYKAPSAKKMLQIQAGAKPLRAITRVMDYFKDVYKFEGFEDFRIQHSLIMNDKEVKGKVCVSIHPLDFMTMSDNQSNWSSCMSWKNDGCYRVGTIEMMNSNNVVCAYLKNDSTPFVIEHKDTGEVFGEWNNKKWRQLFYVNKNIIMSGKAYPYIQEDITRFVLGKIKELAEENLNWTYAFGIEPYKDMLHVTNGYRMEKQREWMRAKSHVKNNIIWDTKGMYNDMLNDSTYPYLCYRNKVDNTKIYSVSGKCPCLKCGDNIVEFDPEEGYYNDRYHNTGAVLCRECFDNYDGCDFCDSYAPTMVSINMVNKNYPIHDVTLCFSCFDKRVRICPCCGEIMYITNNANHYDYSPKAYEYFKAKLKENSNIIEAAEEDNLMEIDPIWKDINQMEDYLKDEENVEIIYLCENCQQAMKAKKDDYIKVKLKSYWGNFYTYRILDPKKYESWRYYNLAKPEKAEYYIPTAS